MAKKRPDTACILDMKNAVQLALQFTSGLNQEQFESDSKCQSAVLYQLAVLGEAAKQVSKNFREAHPEFHWKGMTGLRDILIHAYHGLDMDVIWKIVSSDLPKLLSNLQRV